LLSSRSTHEHFKIVFNEWRIVAIWAWHPRLHAIDVSTDVAVTESWLLKNPRAYAALEIFSMWLIADAVADRHLG